MLGTNHLCPWLVEAKVKAHFTVSTVQPIVLLFGVLLRKPPIASLLPRRFWRLWQSIVTLGSGQEFLKGLNKRATEWTWSMGGLYPFTVSCFERNELVYIASMLTPDCNEIINSLVANSPYIFWNYVSCTA